MNENLDFTPQQIASIRLIQNDLRFIYTVILNRKQLKSNYVVSCMPLLGTIIDGAEDWLKAYNNSHKVKLNVPSFTHEEEKFYSTMRSAIKLWESPFSTVRDALEKLYKESDQYFSEICKPIARHWHLYDIFGADLVNNHFCGNTILCSYYVPDYSFYSAEGERVKRLSEIGGKFISVFNAKTEYNVDRSMIFTTEDYGGFKKSPVGNAFSDKFILFSLLCQIQFVLICVEQYILDECSTKLRFLYLQYFSTLKILDDLNSQMNTNFYLDDKWKNDQFRNAMAHYKIGVSLKTSEIVKEDLFFGLTQKFFNCTYFDLKTAVIESLSSLVLQLRQYLHLS